MRRATNVVPVESAGSPGPDGGHLVLGAGCAGLALTRALVDRGVESPITLLEQRTSYANDRTWCFWQTEPEVVRAGGVDHRWHAWELIGRDGRRIRQCSDRHPYVQLRADRYYADSLEALGRSPGVELRLGERVRSARRTPRGTLAVTTATGAYEAGRVYDAMGTASPLAADAEPGSIELLQSFLGLEVETAEDAFDPEVATLMDFRTRGGERDDGGLHFVYVLPTSPRRALVEHTTLGPQTLPARARREAIRAYLSERWGVSGWSVVREERGALPMSTRRFPLSRGPGVAAIGAAAGAVRPSSGYAFTRIQRHVEAVADAVANGGQLPARMTEPRRDLLDLLFLRSLASDPGGFEQTLLDLAGRTDGDRFARFMSDAGSVADDLAMVRAALGARFLSTMALSSLMRPITARDRAA